MPEISVTPVAAPFSVPPLKFSTCVPRLSPTTIWSTSSKPPWFRFRIAVLLLPPRFISSLLSRKITWPPLPIVITASLLSVLLKEKLASRFRLLPCRVPPITLTIDFCPAPPVPSPRFMKK